MNWGITGLINYINKICPLTLCAYSTFILLTCCYLFPSLPSPESNTYPPSLLLDQPHPPPVPLINNLDLPRLLAPEDIEVVVDVVQSEDRLGEGDGRIQVEGLYLRDLAGVGVPPAFRGVGGLVVLLRAKASR